MPLLLAEDFPTASKTVAFGDPGQFGTGQRVAIVTILLAKRMDAHWGQA
jgi:hypothetical protein